MFPQHLLALDKIRGIIGIKQGGIALLLPLGGDSNRVSRR